VLSEIVPATEIGHPAAGPIELRVNGEVKQRADISQLIHKVPEVIAHLSTFYHLQPGDLIYTGTPEGVGPVTPGDALAGTIAGVGHHHVDDRSRGVGASMLKGCVPWPEEFARRYIEAGLWEGITVAEMVERTARRQPQKVAVIHGETRTTYDELVRSAKRVAGGLANLDCSRRIASSFSSPTASSSSRCISH
jgi:hypothetical protein